MSCSIDASVSGSGGLIQSADNTGILQLKTAGTTAVTIDASQNVGIGTTSPSGKFHVANANTAGTSADNLGVYFSSINRNCDVYIKAKNTEGSKLNFGDGDNDTVGRISYEHSTNHMAFDINAAERMRIASNGQLLLGTTTNSGRSPPLIISNDSGTTNWAVGPSSGGSTQFYVSAGAGVYLSSTSATSWTANSDERLKNITGKIENALDAISTLTPAKFTWKSDETNTPQVGLIAQEVEKVLPEVVDKNADEYLGVRYTETIPLLVAAIQEQQTIINDLKARVTALEAK